MWQWEGSNGVKVQSDAAPSAPGRATAFADDVSTSPAGAFAHLDIANSSRSCARQG
jgi:hypothetical protein